MNEEENEESVLDDTIEILLFIELNFAWVLLKIIKTLHGVLLVVEWSI